MLFAVISILYWVRELLPLISKSMNWVVFSKRVSFTYIEYEMIGLYPVSISPETSVQVILMTYEVAEEAVI